MASLNRTHHETARRGPTDQDIANLSAHLAFELGSSVAAVKFASDIGRYDPQVAEAIVANLPPTHRELLNDLYGVQNA